MKNIILGLTLILSIFSCNKDRIDFEFAVDIFPNPCVDFVVITPAINLAIPPSSEEPYIRLIDAKNDNIISSFSISKLQVSVDMSEEDPGEYYVQLLVDNSVVSTDILLKAD